MCFTDEGPLWYTPLIRSRRNGTHVNVTVIGGDAVKQECSLSNRIGRFGRSAALAVGLWCLPAAGQVVINEIDYDQPGTDTNEYIEVFGPGGMSVAGWSLVLYNGSGGTVYTTVNLTGNIPADGYLVIGTATVPNVDVTFAAASNAIQNGAPDGAVLVNNLGAVVDAISYEGSFTAVGGAANGMVLPDIGVADLDPFTQALQRIPDGSDTWTSCPAGGTPGSSNNCDAPIATGGLTLSQADTPVTITLQGSLAGPGTLTFRILSLPANGTLSPPGVPPYDLPNANVDYTPTPGFSGLDSFTFDTTNGPGGGTANSMDAVQELAVQANNTVVITEIMYSPIGDDEINEYLEIYNHSASAVTLTRLDSSTATAVDTTDNLGGVSIPAGDYRVIAPGGTPESDEAFRCNWQLPEAKIIRVPNVSGDDGWENLTPTSRIYLFGDGASLLDAVDLSRPGFPSIPVNPMTMTNEGQSIEVDVFLLFGNPFNSENNDNETLLVWQAANAVFDQTNVRTAVNNGDRGDPGFVPMAPNFAGTGPFVAEPACEVPTGACCMGATGCAIMTAQDCITVDGAYYSGDGTACGTSCQCVTIAEAEAAGTGQIRRICDAVVSSTTDLISSANNKNFHMQDATGGITVFGSNAVIDPILALIAAGDQIDLAGTTGEFNGLFQLQLLPPPNSEFILVSNDGPVGIPTPTNTTAADFQSGSASAEFLESQLVRLPCVTFQNIAPGQLFAGTTTYMASPDGGTTLVGVRVGTAQLDLVGQPIPTDPVTLVGIFSQFDTVPPFVDGYELHLRSLADITECTAETVSIVSANPPTAADNPFEPGEPYLDVLDTGSSSMLTAGIGGDGTLPQGSIQYDPIEITLSDEPSSPVLPEDITVTCTGGSCPTVTGVVTLGASIAVSLSSPIPPGHCTTIALTGDQFAADQRVQYRSQPGNVSLDALTNTQDLLNQIQALNNGTAAANPARYNVNRTGPANTQDLLRIVQLLNGALTTEPFNGDGVAACPN